MLGNSKIDMPAAEQIIFGTMRMHEIERKPEIWAEFFEQLYARGVRVLHSSDEYESFALLCASLEHLRKSSATCRFRHVVKLAEPSFDNDGFNRGRLAERLMRYSDALQSDLIDDVQWMWRQDLKNEPKRISDLTGSLSEISETVVALKQQGLMRRFFCFPYTTTCSDALLDAEFVDGFTIYRNQREHEFDYLLDSCADRSKTCLVIRPFAAGDLLEAGRPEPREQLAVALDHIAIEAAILSTSSLAHLDDLIG